MSQHEPLRGRRVLVGGGCGFFGSYLVPALVAAGARVRVADSMENGRREALAEVAGEVEIVEADLRDRTTCDRVMAGQELFVNLAAKASGVGFSRTHHAEMLADNLLCGIVPLQAAQRHGVPHVVTTSSSCVYSDDAPVPTPELDAFVGAPEQVNQGYGWAKRIQELASGYFAQDYGMRITILRPLNLYGANYPWRGIERAHVIPA
jgi:nucleoside-diphosphate-sugar epimerase